MANAATQRKPRKKTTQKTQSRFYVVNTAQQTRENLIGLLEEYNQKLINEPLKNSKKVACSLGKQPRKTVAGLLDDGKEYITDLNKETRLKVNGIVKEGRSFLAKAGKNPRKTFVGMIDDGMERVEELQHDARDRMAEVVEDYKELINGIGHDTQLIVEDILDGGKKALDKLPGKKMVEKEISRGMEKIPGLLNIPSQKEINSLTRRVRKLHNKVEGLSKALVA
ncbi:MAG: hypothetical protein WBG37_09515 [Desulfobacterales bacterium]|jgi:hypothetical protein